MSEGVRCMWMRGGTSKGGYFLRDELPADARARDALLLRIMGSPDARQIDGMGGADPLTSKIAVVGKSTRPGVDVDYLFLQVAVDQPLVSGTQNCGNILAGVAPFAIERGLIAARDGETPVTVFMENSGQVAVIKVQTPHGRVTYEGATQIDGVPTCSAPVSITFRDTAGSACGALLPTGNVVDQVDGLDVTMIDNGMPCVLLRAQDVGITGTEAPDDLEASADLRRRLEALRLACGPLMNLGDVKDKTTPKVTLVSAPLKGGMIATRTFIPHRCHKAIGVLGAVSVATACLLKGSVATGLAQVAEGNKRHLSIEHPTGAMTVVATLDDEGFVSSAGILRTARKLMDGWVF